MWSSMRPASERRNAQPAALVVGVPWLRSGTGKVLEAQMEFFRSIGWNALFVAVPHREQHTSEHAIWTQFSSQAKELPYFPHVVQTFDRRVRKQKSLGGLRFRKKDKTALDFNFQISDSIAIDDDLREFISNNHIKVIIGNHVYTTPFCLKIKRLCEKYWGNTHLATVTHDVQAYIIKDNEVKNPWTKRQDNIEHLLRCELDMLQRSDSLIHVSDDDLQWFSSQMPNIAHFLTLPPITEQKTDYTFPEHAKSDLLFVGSNHVANLESLQWYFQRVTPHYVEEPSLTIIGNIDDLVKGRDEALWNRRRQHFQGSVADTTPYYARSRVAIAPMISGRGISIKTIEALAFSKPVVGGRFAFRGFPRQTVQDHGFQFCDQPSDFAVAVGATLQNLEEHQERSKRLHNALFTFDRFAKAMTDVLAAAGVRA